MALCRPRRGAPNFIVGNVSGSNHALDLFKFHVDFVNPQNSTFTGPFAISGGPVHRCLLGRLRTAKRHEYYALRDWPVDYVPACLSQLRPSHRSCQRSLRRAHQSMVVTHTVQNSDGSYGIRWYELRALEKGDFTAFQQSTFAPDNNTRWMASLAMDKVGDMAMGYSISSSTMYPSINFTGRAVHRSAKHHGAGSQHHGGHRFADRTPIVGAITAAWFPIRRTIALLWYTTEYLHSGLAELEDPHRFPEIPRLSLVLPRRTIGQRVRARSNRA